ncbi:MAG: hypothetical protein ETSY2_26755 [Candidatus Entotheonella gemina]|uniref:Uncharacterized protein n=1 Tax=Candidatus Entotheonella gemina TaxID=1429439 RepID=W4M3R2_9BACT|nr:MAG: hypothetical protein ETSY2_26755 [Candidatus Entotheonella gemina]
MNTAMKTSAWTLNQFVVGASAVIAATVCGNRDKLLSLAAQYRGELASQTDAINPPLAPWEDQTVGYGALLGLIETTEIAARTVVTPIILKALLNSSENRRILKAIAKQPGGVVKKSNLPKLICMHRSNIHPQVSELEELGLIAKRESDYKGAKIVIALQDKGWAAIELINFWDINPDEDGEEIVHDSDKASMPEAAI